MIAALLATAVAISGQAFDPADVTVVVGDTVTWRNTDFIEHVVRAADGSFDSGRLAHFGAYAHRFDGVAAAAYLCTIHPFMRGQVDVAGALLYGPAANVLAGVPLRIEGRAAAGAPSVALERELRDGSWQAVATTAPGSDGAFAFVVVPAASSRYRAVTAAGPSPAVTVNVSADVEVHVTARRARRHRLVRVRTRPAAPHMIATLQRYSRWHYRWRRLARERLGVDGRTAFTLPASARGLVRVRLNRDRRGPPLATSRPVRLRNGKPAADPLTAP
jgi:hypothetical protein